MICLIVDLILLVFKSILNLLLSPIALLDISIDFLASFPIVGSFLQVVAYVIPWSNILPLIVLIIAIFVFRIAMSLFKLILSVIH